MNQQIIISGLGGQGILFITRLLAEAAIDRGLPVLTSETHGMAQRGGVVISHLKVGDFSSPLVRAGRADGIIVMKEENLRVHRSFLKPGGWVAVNSPGTPALENAAVHAVDADRLALGLGDPRSLNLIILGFAIARLASTGSLFCGIEDLRLLMSRKLEGKGGQLQAALAALETGISAA